ncbi:2-hydroxychromene-2-carboxylate isomerase [Phreatobacter aquaticus]|uniref:2-hydroxychromene-2-carboxylate isomerase n=1 Tax=Phreatobacter aquaticus TaxID=2570229 RepID=A0A4D7QAD6_9HYPH|nr:2-hydroxychromene-2-carboxylate isomerase [Phreatobacter aquaticus]QCK85050.1 2-hydroxychromene-2-carboxylate isomerase [Phreatobacter aquaticus]
MAKTVELIFDFGSPNAYLVAGLLPDIAARTGASIVYTPCLLGGIFKATNNLSPFQRFADVPAKLAYERLEMKRFIVRHTFTRFRLNPHFPVNTLVVMRGLIAAEKAGLGEPYRAAVLKAMWEDGEKMDDPDVVVRVLDAAGLDGQALVAATQDPAVKQALVANTEAAVARGVFGIPTFFVGSEMFFGKERLGQVEDMLAAT